jgi:hypothetical protein
MRFDRSAPFRGLGWSAPALSGELSDVVRAQCRFQRAGKQRHPGEA